VNRLQTIICLSAVCAVGSAAPADVTLTSGEAYIAGFALIGIDERIEWDGSGSTFSALIDEEATQTTGNLDRTATQLISQDTSILGSVGDSFRGVSTISSAFGSIEKRGTNPGGTNNFLFSTLVLRFTVEQPGFTYDLSGILESTGGPRSNGVLLRRFSQPDGGGIPLETIISGDPPEFPFEFERSGSLTPGFWLLELRSKGSVDGFVPPPSLSTASFGWDVDFTIVPAPGATGVLALAGLAASRRRRGCSTSFHNP